MTDCASGESQAKRRAMPKPKLYTEDVFIRAPEGTKARIDAQRGDTRQGDFLRRVLLGALADMEAGKWSPPAATDKSQT